MIIVRLQLTVLASRTRCLKSTPRRGFAALNLVVAAHFRSLSVPCRAAAHVTKVGHSSIVPSLNPSSTSLLFGDLLEQSRRRLVPAFQPQKHDKQPQESCSGYLALKLLIFSTLISSQNVLGHIYSAKLFTSETNSNSDSKQGQEVKHSSHIIILTSRTQSNPNYNQHEFLS